jgi:hypothetical protein
VFKSVLKMLKIQSHLGRALRYQSAICAERTVGHFDDSAKDLAGPPSKYVREPLSVRTVEARLLPSTRNLMARVDPATKSIVGYFSDKDL